MLPGRGCHHFQALVIEAISHRGVELKGSQRSWGLQSRVWTTACWMASNTACWFRSHPKDADSWVTWRKDQGECLSGAHTVPNIQRVKTALGLLFGGEDKEAQVFVPLLFFFPYLSILKRGNACTECKKNWTGLALKNRRALGQYPRES